MSGHLERIRQAEFDAVHRWFTPGLRVLELGGGNGYQAAQLTAAGCHVSSVDIAGRPPADHQYFPVQEYDGVHLPFGDGIFDLVFSSNVLEHVQAIDALLAEVRRVLKRGGRAVHVLPTPAWRVWTSLAHYPYLLKYAISRERPMPGATKAESPAGVAARRGWAHVLKRALSAGPHGEYPNAASEVYYFSERRWRRLFERNGYEVQDVYPAGIFYTGYCVMPSLGTAGRMALSRALGSACKVYVLHRAP